MTLVMQSDYPFDDTDNFVYVLKEGGWVLDKTVYCRRFDSCRFPSISGHSDNSLQSREQHKIWHGFQLKNPFIVDREVLRYQEANGESSEVGGHLTFSFKGSKSVLTYHTLPGPDTGATLTFNIGLQINGGESIELSNAQCETELVGKYLLLYKFWGEGTELVDIETGKSLFGKLKFADWLYYS